MFWRLEWLVNTFMDEIRNLSGLLLDWPARAIQRADILRNEGVRFEAKIEGSAWERFTFASKKPLHGEDPSVAGPPYHYPIVARRSGSRILVLSLTRQIVEHLLDFELHRVISPPLRRVSIAVDQLVKNLAERPTSYALSFAHARVPAFGASLRAVSFYGEDLAEASLFREQLSLLVFFICGLREAKGGNEIVRLGGDGFVSFAYSGPRRVTEVEQTLAFLRAEGYLSTEIWPSE